MKYWNDLDQNILFEKIFSRHVEIGQIALVKITKENNQFYFQATNKNALIEFKAKFITLVDPNIYINGPDDYFFR